MTDGKDVHLYALRAQQQQLLVQLAERDAALISVRGRVLALRRSVRMERSSLHALALSFERWMPVAAIDGVDAIVGDLRGCAELFRAEHGTEGCFLASMRDWLATQGVRAQAVMADTVGAALAVARHSLLHGLACVSLRDAKDACTQSRGEDLHHAHSIGSVLSGKEREALAPLPLIALRADPGTVAALASVDVHTVGQLAVLGRHGIAARFATIAPRGRVVAHKAARAHLHDRAHDHAHETACIDSQGESSRGEESFQRRVPRKALLHAVHNILHRFDQAIGVIPEVLAPVRFIRRIREEQVFAGPVLLVETVLLAVASVLDRVCITLARDGLLLRSCVLHFDRADLPALRVNLQLGQPTVSRARIWTLLRPQLERMQLGYGVLGVTLLVHRVETARLRHTLSLLDPHATDQRAAPRAPLEIDEVLPASLVMRAEHHRSSTGSLVSEGTLAETESAPHRLRVGTCDHTDAMSHTFARSAVEQGMQLIDTVRARFGDASTWRVHLCDDSAVPWRMQDQLVDSQLPSPDEPTAVIVPALRPSVLFARVEPLLWRQDGEQCIRTQLVQSAICGLPWCETIEVHWRGCWHRVKQVAGFERLIAPWWVDGRSNAWIGGWNDVSSNAWSDAREDGRGEVFLNAHGGLSRSSLVHCDSSDTSVDALKVRSWTALRVQLQDGLWLWALWKDEDVCYAIGAW